MAAYQCLNCHQIERGGEDCCETPDLFCINDMPGEIKRLRQKVEELTQSSATYFAERNSARDAWRARVTQCEALAKELKQFRGY